MCDCGNGRGVPANPCLMEYDINGTVLHKIKLQLPLHVSTKLRFMDVYGDSIYISDLGKSNCPNLITIQVTLTLCSTHLRTGFVVCC